MLNVAFVNGANSPITKVGRISWETLVERLTTTSVGEKDGPAWLPSEIPTGPRKKERVKSVSALVLDVERWKHQRKDADGKPIKDEFDYGPDPVAPDAMLAEVSLRGWRAIIHTSYSHTPEHPRYRLALELSRPLQPDELAPVCRYISGLLGVGDCVDKACFEPARLFYLPRCTDASTFWSGTSDGKAMAVDAIMESVSNAETARNHRAKHTPASGKVIDAFNAAHDIGAIVERHGYEPRGRTRWLRPGSSTGMPGLVLLPDSEPPRVFAHSADDALGDGKAHDAFDCFLILEHNGNMSSAVKAAARAVGMDRVAPTHQPAPENAAHVDSEGSGGTDADALAGIGFDGVQPADLFADVVVPPFPITCLPDAIADFAMENAAQSGFDVGAYAFACLVTCANTIDHRVKIKISESYKQPAFVWGGLADNSGGGKSAVINAAGKPAYDINDAMMESSKSAFIKWKAEMLAAKKNEESPPIKPLWKQRHVLDTSVEALADVLVDNPEGVNFYFDEVTEFVGRMDAYSGGGGKDRGVYLRSYDGGSIPINRKSTEIPQVVPDFSLGILAGLQYEKLAQLFRQKGTSADGLYQRIICYAFGAAGDIDLFAEMGEDTSHRYAKIVRQIHEWNKEKTFLRGVTISPSVKAAMQEYLNAVRTVAQRTSAPRLKEHLNRFGGFAARLLLALHITECAAEGRASYEVEAGTFNRLSRIMAVLYRHAEFVYSRLDDVSGDVMTLVKAAGEATLSKGWKEFKRGDLTRDATRWQGSSQQDAEAAIDLLIELGWIRDVTPSPTPGRRGRKSEGWFIVNPAVHTTFFEHSQRIARVRSERFAAINKVAHR